LLPKCSNAGSGLLDSDEDGMLGYCLNDKRDAWSLDLVSDVAIDLPNKSEVPGRCGAIELQHLYAELTATLIVLLAASAALEPTFKELL
jgi:hypothetical protein